MPAISGNRCCDSVWTILLHQPTTPIWPTYGHLTSFLHWTDGMPITNVNWRLTSISKGTRSAADGVTHSLPLTTHHHQYGSTTSDQSSLILAAIPVVEPGWSVHKEDVQHLHVHTTNLSTQRIPPRCHVVMITMCEYPCSFKASLLKIAHQGISHPLAISFNHS
jgi:hypothetical protein